MLKDNKETMKNELVTYDTAKLAKDKGFDYE